ncbi:Slp family lipoprotein [Kaarinaea lacus]
MKPVFSFILAFLLFGCAAQPPAPIARVPAGNVSLAEVRQDISRYKGTEVRWGGEISRVDNRSKDTRIEVVARDLMQNGQPRETGHSSGRFIASFKGFVDPMVYQVGMQLTVLGSIEGESRRIIGDYDYVFPVVSVTGSYLWPVVEETRSNDYPPWWYYDPWPYYPWPYYPPYW